MINVEVFTCSLSQRSTGEMRNGRVFKPRAQGCRRKKRWLGGSQKKGDRKGIVTTGADTIPTAPSVML